MSHLVIDQQDCRMETERQTLLVYHDSWPRPQRIPLAQLESIVIQTRMRLDSAILSQCAALGVRLVVLPSPRSGEACQVMGDGFRSPHRRLQQYQLWKSPTCVIQCCRSLVRKRLNFQAELLENAATLRPELSSGLKLSGERLRQKASEPNAGFSAAQWRGVEGSGAALFFSQYQQLFAESLHFSTRNRRPPKDPVNALLSLGYTLLHHSVTQAVLSIGLDPLLGTLHSLKFGRNSLVCDLAELQRHHIEYWVWRLFAEQTLTEADFEDFSGKRCYLAKVGRSRFYREWSQLAKPLFRESLDHCRLFVKWLDTMFPMPELSREAEAFEREQDNNDEADGDMENLEDRLNNSGADSLDSLSADILGKALFLKKFNEDRS